VSAIGLPSRIPRADGDAEQELDPHPERTMTISIEDRLELFRHRVPP